MQTSHHDEVGIDIISSFVIAVRWRQFDSRFVDYINEKYKI